MHDVLISFGANLGDTRATLRAAEERLAGLSFVRNLRRGACLVTAPVGGEAGDADFLNTVFRVDVAEDVSPDEFLSRLQEIEAALGRERNSRWGARKIDLDILLFGDRVVDDRPRLVIPHPLLPWRRFVLDCAAEVAGDMVHPLTGLTVKELSERLNHADENFRFTPSTREMLLRHLTEEMLATVEADVRNR